MSETSDNANTPASDEPVSSEPSLRVGMNDAPKAQLSVSEITQKLSSELNGALDELAKIDKALNRTYDSIEHKIGQLAKHTKVISNPGFNSVESYLSYAQVAGTSPKSTVFRGSLYEISFAEFLVDHLNLRRMVLQGGANDKGIDMQATWNLKQLKRVPEKPADVFLGPALKHVVPFVEQKQNDAFKVHLYVQCKCWKRSKMDAKMVRELTGTFADFFAREKLQNRALVMFVTPTGATKVGFADFDSSVVPMIFVKFSVPELKSPGLDPYKAENYIKGRAESFYCNPIAQALLSGLDWKAFANTIVRNQK
ncbi:hypothetical protein KL944_004991 [Ogataea haglerorum]|nr:hypothetical protein KL944_004991 [Ogataea haglerorum]